MEDSESLHRLECQHIRYCRTGKRTYRPWKCHVIYNCQNELDLRELNPVEYSLLNDDEKNRNHICGLSNSVELNKSPLRFHSFHSLSLCLVNASIPKAKWKTDEESIWPKMEFWRIVCITELLAPKLNCCSAAFQIKMKTNIKSVFCIHRLCACLSFFIPCLRLNPWFGFR